jgi:hypothetical protein
MNAGRLGLPAGLVALSLTLSGLVTGSSAPDRPTAAAVPDPVTVAAGSGVVNGIPAAALAQMSREAPLVSAALRIKHAAGDGAAAGYTGVALTPAGDGVDVFWKGQPAGAARREIDAVAGSLPVRVHAAPWSKAELDTAAATRVEKETTAGKAATAAKAAPSKAASGKAALTKAALAGVTLPSPSRQNDTRPAWAGAHIINSLATGGNDGWLRRDEIGAVVPADNKYHCTSGFPVRNPANGIEYMLTAASCGKPRQLFVDPVGEGVSDPLAGDDNWIAGPWGVMLSRPVGGAEPFLYTGDSWSNTGWSIDRADGLVENQHVCVSGAETGVTCGAIVTSLNGGGGYVPNWSGHSDQLNGMAILQLNTAGRSYTLQDGTACGVGDPTAPENLNCPRYLGPGDIGAPIFTIDGGASTGATIRGLILRNQIADGDQQRQYNSEGLDAALLMSVFQGSVGTVLQAVTKNNDVP